MSGELSPASVYVSLLPVVEACVVVAVPGRVGEVRVAADEPEAVDLDPGVLARGLDAPATVKAILEQGGRVVLRGRARAWDCFRLATGFTALVQGVRPQKTVNNTSPPNHRRRGQAHGLEDALPPTPKDAQFFNIGTTLLRKKYPKKKRGEEQGVIY